MTLPAYNNLPSGVSGGGAFGDNRTGILVELPGDHYVLTDANPELVRSAFDSLFGITGTLSSPPTAALGKIYVPNTVPGWEGDGCKRAGYRVEPFRPGLPLSPLIRGVIRRAKPGHALAGSLQLLPPPAVWAQCSGYVVTHADETGSSRAVRIRIMVGSQRRRPRSSNHTDEKKRFPRGQVSGSAIGHLALASAFIMSLPRSRWSQLQKQHATQYPPNQPNQVADSVPVSVGLSALRHRPRWAPPARDVMKSRAPALTWPPGANHWPLPNLPSSRHLNDFMSNEHAARSVVTESVNTGTPNANADSYYDPYDFEIHRAPYPIWTRLSNEQPLYYNSKYDFYALSRYEDVERCSKDWRTYSSAKGTLLELIRAGVTMPPGIIIFEDPPEHDLYRGLLTDIFSPRPWRRSNPRCASTARAASILRSGTGGFDFIADLGRKVPMRTIGMLLGIPEEDQEAIRDRIDDGLRLKEGAPPPPDMHERLVKNQKAESSPSTSSGAPRSHRTT